MIRIKIKEKMYLIVKQKDVINLIKERGITNFTKTPEITIKDIKVIVINGVEEVIIKVLNHKTLQQQKKYPPTTFNKTLHRGNP